MLTILSLAEMDCEVVQYARTPQWIETVDNPKAGSLTRLVGHAGIAAGQGPRRVEAAQPRVLASRPSARRESAFWCAITEIMCKTASSE